MGIASMFQSEGGVTQVVGGKKQTAKLPHPPIQALQQGSVGNVMSDLQNMMETERKQHMDTYKYAHGHNDHGQGQ